MPAGRPLKNGVTYFPLEVALDDKFELVEAEHGIVGFGVIIKLYQKIYADNYYIIWDKKAILVFSNRINVDINSINAIINSCLEWDIFSKKLFDKFGALTSKGIQERFFFIAKRRKLLVVCKELMLTIIDINAYKKVEYVDINSQRKGKGKVKGEGKGEGKGKFTPPTIQEVESFFLENGYTKQSGSKAFKYYKDGSPSWHDSRGNPVKGWKQKMRGVWFKDENKIPTSQIKTDGIKAIDERDIIQDKVLKIIPEMDKKNTEDLKTISSYSKDEAERIAAFQILRERGKAID